MVFLPFFFSLFHFFYYSFFHPFFSPRYEHISGKAFYFYNSDTHYMLLRLDATIPVPDDFEDCHKTKTKIFQQQVAAWVSTCEQLAQPTLGNLAHFFASKLFFISPHASAPRRQVSHLALHHKQQISRHPDATRCLKATLWKIILIYPFNLGGKVNIE